MNITLLHTLKVSLMPLSNFFDYRIFSNHAPYFFSRKKSKQNKRSAPEGMFLRKKLSGRLNSLLLQVPGFRPHFR
jgi:hypothetical protein